MEKIDLKKTWRLDTMECHPGLQELNFFDTSPNQFLIMNQNTTDLYIGITNIPKVEKYEYIVKAMSNGVVGRPVPTNRLYVYNPSTNELLLNVYSIEGDFDIGLLKNDNMEISGDSIEGIAFDGIVKGFNCKLPSGDNTIGKVIADVENDGELLKLLTTIKEDGTSNKNFNFYLMEKEKAAGLNVDFNTKSNFKAIEDNIKLIYDYVSEMKPSLDIIRLILSGEMFIGLDENNLFGFFNKIKEVVSSIDTSVKGALPAGNNTIGKVLIDGIEIPPLEVAPITIDNVKTSALIDEMAIQSLKQNINFKDGGIYKIEMLKNLGKNPITLKIDNNCSISLNAGESLYDLKIDPEATVEVLTGNLPTSSEYLFVYRVEFILS